MPEGEQYPEGLWHFNHSKTLVSYLRLMPLMINDVLMVLHCGNFL
jgi:hypothetical protein